MNVIGIDAGFQYVKAVVLSGNGKVNCISLPAGHQSASLAAEQAVDEALKAAGLSTRSEVESFVATGSQHEYVSFATHHVAEFFCLAKGVYRLSPEAEMVMDIGAQKSLAVRCRQGIPLHMANNDRCGAGSGRFLEVVGEILHVPLEEMGGLSMHSHEQVEVLSTCAVFAESEIISLVHQKKKKEDILRAVFTGLAARAYVLALKAGFERNLRLVGGVARNIGFVRALEERFGQTILVPDRPEMVTAFGAAWIARERLE